MLQIRPQGGGIAYAPYRDIGLNFVGLARLAIKGLEETKWCALIKEYLELTKPTDADFGAAIEAFAKYIELCLDPKVKNSLEAMEAAGMLKVPTAAQLALMAKLGEVITSLFFKATREAHSLDEPQIGLEELLQDAAETSQRLSQRTHETYSTSTISD